MTPEMLAVFAAIGAVVSIAGLWFNLSGRIRDSILRNEDKIAEVHKRVDLVKDNFARRDDVKQGFADTNKRLDHMVEQQRRDHDAVIEQIRAIARDKS